jgi:NAD(P)-dependent dehydrogenase (short-subunit alcohol dehydrogenase family)
VSRAVLITGATGALGTAVTGRFVEDGYKVASAALDATGVARGPVKTLQADVTDPTSIARLTERTVEELGTIDVLIHLVGGWVGGIPLQEHTPEMWDRVMDLNLRSAFLCARGVLPIMRERGWGRIVFVSSRSARADRHFEGGYATAKAGVAVLAEIIAEENRDLDVTANVVAPSILDTPANRKARPDTDPIAMVSLEDAARIIAFLASSEAGQLRGAWLPVFGRV